MKEKLEQFKKFFPALAFLSGFTWDALTLGRVVTVLDLWILFAYWIGAGLMLTVMGKGWKPAWNPKFTFALQFFFGGLFSALLIFYFKSTGSVTAFLFILALAGLLVANEFLQNSYEKQWLPWTLFALTGMMLLNFMVPHLVSSVHWLWFFFSGILALAFTEGLRRLCRGNLKILVGPGTAFVVLVLLFIAGWLPPVPLVLKQNQVCRDFERTDGEYICRVDEQGFAELFGLMDHRVIYTPGEKVWCLSSVFAPKNIEVKLEHRWYIETEEGWSLTDKIPLRMKGGRQDGWRFYSNKQSVRPGVWKVETTRDDGRVLGYRTFTLYEADSNSIEHPTETFMLE